MKTFIYICLCTFVVFFIFEMIRKYLSNRICNELIKYIYLEKEDDFENLINSKSTIFWVFPYNRFFLKLNMAISKNDIEKVKKCIGLFDNLKLKQKQKEAIYQRCFSYFVTINNSKEAKKYYELLKSKNNNTVEEIDIIYSTLVLKEDKYLELCLNRNDNLSGNDRISNESYISQMYANRGDKKNAEKYRDTVASRIQELNSANQN